MARYFFHLHECGEVTIDLEGCELPDFAAAQAHAEIAARAIMCSEMTDGDLCLGCHIEIEDRAAGERSTIEFRDVVRITG